MGKTCKIVIKWWKWGKIIEGLNGSKKWGEEVIMKKKEEKDLGVIIQDTLTPKRHKNGIFASTYRTQISGDI